MKKKLPLLLYTGLFAVVIGLLTLTSVSGARSTLIESADYIYDFEMYHIGITLLEYDPVSGTDVEKGWRNYEYNDEEGNWVVNDPTDVRYELLSHINPFVVGKTYEEKLAVRNSGKIDQFVRVKVYKYWKNADGYKDPTKDPANIQITYNTDADSFGRKWIIDDTAHTAERDILYLDSILPSALGNNVEGTSPYFTKDITVNGTVLTPVKTETKEGNYTRITYTYEYDGAQFVLEVEADAVQTHNAKDAIKSAWGKDVTISGTKLALN